MAIYMIQAGETGPVKIGVTDDVRARLRDLQCGNHERLVLLREINGGNATEKWLHRHFRSQRVRGEWFVFSADMLSVEPPALVAPVRPVSSIASRIVALFGGQVRLARAIGVGQTTVSDWVRGREIPTQKIRRIIDAGAELSPPLRLTALDFFATRELPCFQADASGGSP